MLSPARVRYRRIVKPTIFLCFCFAGTVRNGSRNGRPSPPSIDCNAFLCLPASRRFGDSSRRQSGRNGLNQQTLKEQMKRKLAAAFLALCAIGFAAFADEYEDGPTVFAAGH